MKLIYAEEEVLKSCDWIIGWSFLVLCFFLPIPHTATVKSIAKLLPLGAWILKMAVRKDFSIEKGPFFVPVLFLLGGALFSLINSHNLSYSIDEIRGDLISPILLYFVLINCENKKQVLKRIYLGFGLSLSFISIVGIVGYFNNINIQNDGRALLIFHQPNIAGMYVACLVVFFIGAYYVFPKTIPVILLVSLVQCMSIFALFLTGSREGILSLVIPVVLFGVFKNRKLLLCFVLFFVISVPFLPTSTCTKLKSFFEVKTYTSKKLQVYGRIFHWKIALKVIKKYPLLGVGYGWENSREIMTKTRNNEVIELPDRILYHAHNTPLEMVVEMGVFGGAAVLVFLFVWFKTCFYAIKRDKIGNIDNSVFFSVICSFFSLFIVGSVDFILRYDQVYLIWLLIGVYSIFILQEKNTLELETRN